MTDAPEPELDLTDAGPEPEPDAGDGGEDDAGEDDAGEYAPDADEDQSG